MGATRVRQRARLRYPEAQPSLPAHDRAARRGASGANDGRAYPFVVLPTLMLTHPPEEALAHWLTRVVLWEVGGAMIAGAFMGYAAGAAPTSDVRPA